MRTEAYNVSICTIAGARELARWIVALAVCAVVMGISATAQTIITFDPPGSVLTGPQAINNAGTITGVYGDANNLAHGFVRSSDGTITSFDAPGHGIQPGHGTVGESINPTAEIAGVYVDASNVFHGFLRHRDGSFVTFDAPGAGTGSGQGTFVAFPDGLTRAGQASGN